MYRDRIGKECAILIDKFCYQYQQKCAKVSFKMHNNVSKLTLVLAVVAIYLIWMDVALYINLQQLPELSQRTENKVKNAPFSPFDGITIKLVMMTPIMQYIDLPTSMWIEDAFQVSKYFTANAVSYLGLLFGLIAARLFMCETYKLRFLGFVFFRLRDLADNLDGIVAR